MRMWMVKPALMCRKHLLGEHVELHMLASHLRLGRKVDGFVAHNCVEPSAIARRHKALAAEMIKRGYKHASPLTQPPVGTHQHLTARVDVAAALDELTTRCVDCRWRLHHQGY
jgi:hypothetical protein